MCYREARISFAFQCLFCGDLVVLLSFTNEHNYFLSRILETTQKLLSCREIMLIHRGGGSCNVRNVWSWQLLLY